MKRKKKGKKVRRLRQDLEELGWMECGGNGKR